MATNYLLIKRGPTMYRTAAVQCPFKSTSVSQKKKKKKEKLHELLEEKIWDFFWFKGKKLLSGKAVVVFDTWKSMSCQ